MIDDHDTISQLPTPVFEELDRLCDDYEQRCVLGLPAHIEDYLPRLPEAHREVGIRELLALDVAIKAQSGGLVDVADYQRRFPTYPNAVAAVIEWMSRRFVGSLPLCPVRKADATEGLSTTRDGDDRQLPQKIGRYQVLDLLGEGAFGYVYRAYDPKLERLVALKVPRARLLGEGSLLEPFLEEARKAAHIDHPAIIGVYDVEEEDGRPYIVQQYIEGTNLAEWQRQRKPTPEQIVRLFIPLTEAVGFAHERGLIHRDLKPRNVLMDRGHGVHVADFGLAVFEGQLAECQGGLSGTPAYMSPEQVRGEVHRLDAGTDIWSLGVMLYELLVGKRPFVGTCHSDLFKSILHREPPPPCDVVPEIPPELSRICLKCLEKRRVDRYACTAALVEDLQCWLTALSRPQETASTDPLRHGDAGGSSGNSGPRRIVPKGLRSFDERDAEFFVQLLPGPYDRDGLPESIRYWKANIEQTNADRTFSVGLLYGPSGCGKSSFVKAGLLPRLARGVLPVYIEATPHETETRLLKGLARRCPELVTGRELPEAMRAIREHIGRGRKMCIFVDQFEQWLHRHRHETDSRLVDGLRQCDGGQLQCVLMVRDDFWMAITRFMWQLEIPIVEGRNSAAVDLFDPQHARKVLMAFGRAYERLPQPPAELTAEQSAFLDQALRQLAEGDKFICLHLALFAHMFKGRPWIPAELKRIGGIRGVGEAFLEESFCAPTAPPEHRLHQSAARAVLTALLPDAGSGIRRTMRPQQDLLAASLYEDRPEDFQGLIRILDGELHLITPTDPQGIDAALPQIAGDEHCPYGDFYQLTHDYLVPSLRTWLTQKQAETRRGRAALRLVELTEVWYRRPDSRFLPVWWEFLSILCWTRQSTWSDPQRRMMRAARRYYLIGLAWVVVVTSLVCGLAYEFNGRLHARALTQGLVESQPESVPALADQLRPYLRWARPGLQQLAMSESADTAAHRGRLHAQLALVASDDTYVPDLQEALLTGPSAYVGIICDALQPYQSRLLGELWVLFHDPTVSAQRRFRAGLALAGYAAEAPQWTAADFSFLAAQLVAANPYEQPHLRHGLRPVGARLLDELERLALQSQVPTTQLLGAVHGLVDFAHRHPARLLSLLDRADPVQYPTLFDAIHDALDSTAAASLPDLPTEFRDASLPPSRRFRAGLAMAADPEQAPQWADDDLRFLAEQLMNAHPDEQPRLREFLRPIGPRLLPILEPMCLDPSLSERESLGATSALADLARNDARQLARVLTLANPVQFQILLPLLAELRDPAIRDWLLQLAATPPTAELSPPDRVALGKRRAGAALALLRLGLRQGVFEALQVDQDPEALTQFVHGCRARLMTAAQLLACLRDAQDARTNAERGEECAADRRVCGLLLALGDFSLDELPPDDREAMVQELAAWYADDPSAAVHGASGWLLRKWGFEQITRQVDETPVAYAPGREWFTLQVAAQPPLHDASDSDQTPEDLPATATPQPVDRQPAARGLYLTFVVFPAGRYQIGSPETEPGRRSSEKQHVVTITRPFAIMDRELTLDELATYDETYLEVGRRYHYGPSHAAAGMNWYDAVHFCRWLTVQAGWSEADQPYPAPTTVDAQADPVDPQTLDRGSPHDWPLRLDRPGFRLPTVAEWEIACRAGTDSMYAFGSDESLLGHYAWFAANSGKAIHRVRTRRPNLGGLFDMHGNVLEWCHDWYGEYQIDGAVDPSEPAELILTSYVNDRQAKRRVSRGGTWAFDPRFCRSAYRCCDMPANGFERVGFRLAFCPEGSGQ